MAYLYPLIWFAAGLIMIFKLRQENKIFIFAGIYFIFLGAWWLVGILHPELKVFSGTLGWTLRGITAAALAVMGVAYYREKKRTDAMLAAEEHSEQGTTPLAESDEQDQNREDIH
jgi:apolipoprotein N-acyltransferase